MGTIRPRSRQLHVRLREIHRSLRRLLDRHRPEHVALEKAFFGRNPSAALRIGEGRGAALAAAGRAGTKLFEYTAMQSKRAVTAGGRASKSAVQRSVKLLLGMNRLPSPDEADAAALAICHVTRHWGW